MLPSFLTSQSQQIHSHFSTLIDRLSGLPSEYQEHFRPALAQYAGGVDELLSALAAVEKSQENSLEAERDRLKALVESMTDEVWYCDLEGNVTMMNDRIVQNLGLEKVEDLNLPIHEIVTQRLEIYRPDGTPRPEAEAPQIRSLQGETVHGQELIRHLKTQELRFREYNSAPIRSKEGKIIGAVGLARDITEVHQMKARQIEIDAQMEVQQRLLEHREMERQQLARDLHDGPIQSLGALGFSLQAIQNLNQQKDIEVMLQQIRDEVKHLSTELRNVCNELRPSLLSRFGLRQALVAHAEAFTQKHSEIHLNIEISEESLVLPDKVVLGLYRIYQEAVNNVLRHAQANEVAVQLILSPRHVIFQVKDNGQGFPFAVFDSIDWIEMTRQNHFGLVGMKERAEAIGGTLKILSQPGNGTTIQVSVPYDRKNGD